MLEELAYSVKVRDREIQQARGKPITHTEWSDYLRIFALQGKPRECWEGKKILDVGSGLKFEPPDRAFPGARVYAIDPEFGKGGRLPHASHTAHEKREAICQAIPYDDNKFDFVFASHSAPQSLGIEEVPRSLCELIRVMKPGGEIRLVLCAENQGITTEIKDVLIKNGFVVEFEGPMTIIKASERISNNKVAKDNAWGKIHREFFPKVKLRQA
ncbi:MAG TPA: methyltransferase domain-containing protein [Candidatus Bathyarchaeia archaeon]|nr:methyltransferase domain-containing protein [Candidatus Bathyarchaeia archaeon]